MGPGFSPLEEVERFGLSEQSEVPWLRGRARALNASTPQYLAMLTERNRLIATLEQFFTTWDVLLCPVAAGPAFQHCPTGTPQPIDGTTLPYWFATGAYVMPFNTTGHPAVVMPLAQCAEGLPIGLQVVGKRWNEPRLLAIAAQLESVTGRFRRLPGY